MVTILNHPLITHKLTIMRQETTVTKDFRELLNEIAELMTYEICRDFPTKKVEITTPMGKTVQPMIDKEIVLIPILRAGLGFVDGIHRLIPTAKVGFIGMYRKHDTLEPVEYFAKFPKEIDSAINLVLDPMLATGGSAIAAINNIKARGAKDIKLVCLVAAPEGVKAMQEAHPDVDIYLAALDERLNEIGYIVPGLGDAGDRIFGTK